MAQTTIAAPEAPPRTSDRAPHPVHDDGEDRPRLNVRTIFISDVHLGTKNAKASELLDLLRHTKCDTIYLVGDIIDGWSLKRSWSWHQLHNDVVQKTLRKARKGTRIVYLPGNHDEFMREFAGLSFGSISIEIDTIHETVDGRRYLVLHGDEFDGVVRHARWLALLGSSAYAMALRCNKILNALRRFIGLPYWSISSYIHRVKNRMELLSHYEHAVASEAARRDADGVICGHIHVPSRATIDGIDYLNTGDWVESCTVLVEHLDGRMELLRWADVAEPSDAVATASA
jgi:UDP-2,3-diacylglucosamine pyrophosphatase LpxH